MVDACLHSQRPDTGGICPDCGECDHDVILNGACLYCGKTELALTHKRVEARAAFVPLERLRAKPE